MLVRARHAAAGDLKAVKKHVAARPGGTAKICISLNEQNWQAAVNLWQPENPSRLVDGLISRYVETGGSLLERRATLS